MSNDHQDHPEQDDVQVAGPADVKRQKKIKNRNFLLLIMACFLVGGGSMIYVTRPKPVEVSSETSQLERRLEKAVGQNSYAKLSDRRNYTEDFARNVETQVGSVKGEVSQQNQSISQMKSEIDALKRDLEVALGELQNTKQEKAANEQDYQNVIDAFGTELQELRNRVDGQAGFPAPIQAQQTPATSNNRSTQTSTKSEALQPKTKIINRTIERVEFQLDPKPTKTSAVLHSAKKYVPAGSYAEARIIIGAKTSAAVDAQSDPRPIVIRILGKAIGPMKNGRHTETDTVGCTINAQAYGDISSEQGHAKLSSMTCTDGKGNTKTVKAYGYIAHRGMYGVHSNVVMREGDLAERAFWSGVVANAGDAANMLIGTTSTSALGTVSTSGGEKDAALKLLSGGAEQTADTLSDYYIKRLEQIQPVIPLKAGTPVDVVFMKEINLDGDETVTQTARVSTTPNKKRIPLDAADSDIKPSAVNQQLIDLLKNTGARQAAPNVTNWNNEFYQ